MLEVISTEWIKWNDNSREAFILQLYLGILFLILSNENITSVNHTVITDSSSNRLNEFSKSLKMIK